MDYSLDRLGHLAKMLQPPYTVKQILFHYEL